MALSIHVTDFPADGIKLIPATDDGFDALARPLIGRVADIGLQLEPLPFVVSNESEHTVVSFSKKWTVRYEGENWCDSAELSCAHLVIQGYADSDPYYDQFLPQFVAETEQMVAHAIGLQIDLDAVIFADGRIIGRDSDGWLSGLFSEYVSAKQNWYRQILDRLDVGYSVDEAYAPIRAFQEENSPRNQPGRGFARDHALLWKTQAAAEATRLRQRLSDDEFPVRLKQSIRLEPFVIHRSE
jgi:hypothetical protein